jgi:hypothetical protein
MLNNKVFGAFLLTLGVVTSGPLAAAKNSGEANGWADQWYLATDITVEDRYGKIYPAVNKAIIGQLDESSSGPDRNDIPSFSSTARSRAAGVFVQSDWGARSGEYLTDYRSSGRKADSWVITVNSSVAGGEVSLKWGALQLLSNTDSEAGRRYHEQASMDSRTLKKLRLIDLKEGEVVRAVSGGELNEYRFTLEPGETSRQLRWVLGPLKGVYFKEDKAAKHHLREQLKEMELADKSDNAKAKGSKPEKAPSGPHPVFGMPPS